MDIFASNAREINDKDDPANNTRYSDTSNNYAGGFKYDNKLNSATLNGILHRITSRLKERIHCSAKALGIDLDRPTRYCSPEEIANEECLDDKNYLHRDQWELYLEKRLKPYFLKEEKYMDFFNPSSFSTKAYLNSLQSRQAHALFCGTNIVPCIVKETEYMPYSSEDPKKIPANAIQVSDSKVLLFEAVDRAPKEWCSKKLYVSVKIIVPADEKLREIEIRCSRKIVTRRDMRHLDPATQFYSDVIPVISFDKDVKYGNRNILANSRFVLSRYCRILMRKNVLFILDGIPGFSQSVSPSQIASILTQSLAEKSKGEVVA